MTINWSALLQVVVVTVLATVVIVALGSFAARFLDAGHARRDSGQGGTALLVGAYGMLGAIGLIILFALYLMVPYFH